MYEQELQELRRRKWRVDGRPIRTIEDARSFLDDNGFCLMYPHRPAVVLPTFIGAWVGSEDGLPTAREAFKDPRAAEATELMVRLLREKAAYEANLFGDTNFLVSASVFPYFYALVGDRNPRQEPKFKGQGEKVSQLAVDTFRAVRDNGPISKRRLREMMKGELSESAVDRALNDLWSVLKITRVGYEPAEGASWDVLYRWSPETLKQGVQVSSGEALSALLSKYLDSVIAADQKEIEDFFSNLVSRSKIKEAVNALLAARELSFVTVGPRTLIQMTPPEAPRGQRAPRPPRPSKAAGPKRPTRPGAVGAKPSKPGTRRPDHTPGKQNG